MSDATVSTLDATVGLSGDSLSPGRLAFRRFLAHRAAVVSVVVLTLLVLWVLLSPFTARYGVNEQVFDISKGANQNLPPSRIAWFGTDIIGRDVYSRVLYGVRVSLIIGIASAFFSLVIGAFVGAVAGLKGGRFDDIIMRVTDIFLAFPFLVALLVVRNMFGSISWVTFVTGEISSIRFMVFLFAIFGWMGVARVLRAQVLSLKEREFVEAARALGASDTRIIVRHLLPNISALIVAQGTILFGFAVVDLAAISFLGLGVQPPQADWGVMVEEGKTSLLQGYPLTSLSAVICIVAVVAAVSLLGDRLESHSKQVNR